MWAPHVSSDSHGSAVGGLFELPLPPQAELGSVGAADGLEAQTGHTDAHAQRIQFLGDPAGSKHGRLIAAWGRRGPAVWSESAAPSAESDFADHAAAGSAAKAARAVAAGSLHFSLVGSMVCAVDWESSGGVAGVHLAAAPPVLTVVTREGWVFAMPAEESITKG